MYVLTVLLHVVNKILCASTQARPVFVEFKFRTKLYVGGIQANRTNWSPSQRPTFCRMSTHDSTPGPNFTL